MNDELITVPQKEYIRGLVEKRDISGLEQAQQEFLSDLSDGNLDRMTKHQAHVCIDTLLKQPYKPKPAQSPTVTQISGDEAHSPGMDSLAQPRKIPEVKDGYFFIVDPTNGEERFFRVKHGKEGTRWEGYIFLDVQASDYFYPIRDQKHKEAVISEIAKDPVKAMNEYGLKLGRCGVCNRTLTDRHSILRGIGPICAANIGPTAEQSNLLRQLGLVKDGDDE